MQLGSGGADAAGAAMDFSVTAGVVIFVVLIALFAVIAVVLAVWKTKRGGAALMRFFAKFLPTKKMSEKIATGKFASAMAIQLVSGIPPEPAVEMAADAVDNPAVLSKIEKSKKAGGRRPSLGKSDRPQRDFCGRREQAGEYWP